MSAGAEQPQAGHAAPRGVMSVAIVGCGARGRGYAQLMARWPGRYAVVAAADPVEARREAVAAAAPPGCRTFAGAAELLAVPRLAELAVIATQDGDHLGPALAALDAGYDLLLEKPVATRIADVEAIDRRARELGRKVVTCFVLRYTPFYRAVKEAVDSGRLGRVISMRALEGVEPWHQAHSFVRGHWARTRDSTPMIVAKSCHDMDILAWLAASPARAVASHGGLAYFHRGSAPPGATARCTDGCPHCGTCPYDAHRYLTDKKRVWLPMVHPGGLDASDRELLEWLEVSPWGRCVYRCGNDAVDHQTVSIEFANGITAGFTMTAFDDGRRIEVFGTRAVLRGHTVSYRSADEQLTVRDHHGGGAETIDIPRAEGGHGGGDHGLIDALYDAIRHRDGCGLMDGALDSHQIAFAAEEARLGAHAR